MINFFPLALLFFQVAFLSAKWMSKITLPVRASIRYKSQLVDEHPLYENLYNLNTVSFSTAKVLFCFPKKPALFAEVIICQNFFFAKQTLQKYKQTGKILYF